MAHNLQGSDAKALKLFHSQTMVTKADVLNNVNYQINAYSGEYKEADDSEKVFLKSIISLMKQFGKAIADSPMFDAPDDWWAYSFEISATEIKLSLEHYGYVGFEGDEVTETDVDASFTLISVKASLLTVEEYGEKYGVQPVTVRQWIRRGKIRTAVKAGQSWRIPELTALPVRGYVPAEYEWNRKTAYFPEGYEYLASYSRAELSQDETDRNLYHVILSDGRKLKGLKMNIKEREALELVLISNPMVTYVSDSFGVFA